jgi:tetratricopeptide (TPR) repeat protein
MNQKSAKLLAYILAVTMTSCAALAQDLDRADLFHSHGLVNEAKREYIEIVTSDDFYDEDKAVALSALGEIAFSENKVALAVSTWSELIEKYPESPQAEQIKARLSQLADVVKSVEDQGVDNVVAQAYISHGDWWSKNKEGITTIDASWIPADQVAIQWFNKAIAEFPKTEAARVAYVKKFQVVLGWTDPGEYGETYGVKKSGNVADLVAVFDDFSSQFPDDSNLQRLRYTIAQAYWAARKFPETKEWLNKIIETDGGTGGFYRDLAEWRLKKVEY